MEIMGHSDSITNSINSIKVWHGDEGNPTMVWESL